MFSRLATKLTVWLLKKSNLSLAERTTLVATLLDRLNAIPSRDIIGVNEEGRLVVNGQPLDLEGARQLREGSKLLLESPTWKFVREQVEFRAVVLGVHNGDTPEKVYFSKVAIWFGQQIDEILQLLAQE